MNYNISKKSNLYYTRLIPFSGVTSEQCPSPRLCAKAHTIKVATVASRWQRMGDLIGSGFEPHPSRTRISEKKGTVQVWFLDMLCTKWPNFRF